MNSITFAGRTFFPLVVGGLLFLMAGHAVASDLRADLPSDVISALHYLLDRVNQEDDAVYDARRIEHLMAFLLTPKPGDALYRADDSFDAPFAYNEFTVKVDLQRIMDYILNADIPSFFFWPSSVRMARWTRLEGGDQQLAILRAAYSNLDKPFVLNGTEKITITPDQHTGAYYSYDVDKMVILFPHPKGKTLISIYRQQAPSAVGKKGWVLGKDDEWSYVYTQENGLNLKGLGWANTYMYDSFGITVYVQPEPETAAVTCATFSWVKAGWAGMNMVKPEHIKNGLVRVAQAFKAVMENPRLPEPAKLARTFATARNLPTPTLEKYARSYFDGLAQRIASSKTLQEEVGQDFDSRTLLVQMTHDELYAALALDYFKKILGHRPVLTTHPF